MMSFGKTLRQLRKKAGLTQVEIAQALGTSQATYSSLEARAELPSEEWVIALAEFFGVTVNHFGRQPEPIVRDLAFAKQYLEKRRYELPLFIIGTTLHIDDSDNDGWLFDA